MNGDVSDACALEDENGLLCNVARVGITRDFQFDRPDVKVAAESPEVRLLNTVHSL